MEKIIFYRYDLSYQTEDSSTDIRITKYDIKKETKKWYWLDVRNGKKRVPKKDNFNKQFARDTKEKAIAHLKRRLKKRIKWYKFRIEQCENWLGIIKEEHNQ